jgi:hypothetical protein
MFQGPANNLLPIGNNKSKPSASPQAKSKTCQDLCRDFSWSQNHRVIELENPQISEDFSGTEN